MTIPSPNATDHFAGAFAAHLRASPRVLAAAFTGWLLLSPTTAHADAATAEALFQAGREAMDKGDAHTACDRFQESYRLDPTAGTALNLGNCRERLGQLASAWQRYEEAVQKLPEGDKRIAVAQSRAAKLAPRIPHLTLVAPASAEDFVVVRDGEPLGRASFGLALPVDPGSHVVVVRTPRHADWSEDVTLTEGQERTLTLELGAALETEKPQPSPASTVPAAPAAPVTASPNAPDRTFGWALTGVGAAGIVTSVIAGVVVLSKKSTVESSCVDKHCSNAGLDAAQTGRTFSTVGTVAFGVGAAALGVGLYLVLSRAPGAKPEQARVAPAGPRLGAAATNGGVQLRLESSF